MMVDGLKRTYHLYSPEKLTDQNKLPMVIVLHGGGSDGQSMMRYTKFNDLADRENLLVLYPDGTDGNWNDGRDAPAINNRQDDVKFISVLIDDMVARHRADSSRVFATGISNGAIFCLFLASKLSEKLLAIAPVCGSIPENYAVTYSIARPMSVMIINGTADPLVRYEGGMVAGERSNRGAVIATDSMVTKLVGMLGCSSIAQSIDFSDSNMKDRSTAVKYVYTDCINKKQLIFIKVTGGGHTWPGGIQYLPRYIIGNVCRDFNATSEIWKFFNHQVQVN